MSLVNQTQFASLAGVSPPSISKAIKKGFVVRGPDGIDTAHPINRAYLKGEGSDQQALRRKHAAEAKAAERLEQAGGKPGGKPPANTEEVARFETEKDVKIEVQKVKLATSKIEYFERVANSIPTQLVGEAFSRLVATLQDNFQAMDERIADEVFTRVEAGETVEEVGEVIRREIDRAMKSVVSTVRHELEQLRVGDGDEEAA